MLCTSDAHGFGVLCTARQVMPNQHDDHEPCATRTGQEGDVKMPRRDVTVVRRNGDDSDRTQHKRRVYPFVRQVRTDHRVCVHGEERARQRVAAKCAPRGHASKTKSSKLVDGVGDDLDRFGESSVFSTALAAAGTQRRRKSIKHNDCRKVMRQCKKTSRAKKLGSRTGQSTRRALNPTRQQHEKSHIRKADPPER
jgi:hypothetical protein